MVTLTQTRNELKVENYQEYTDKYFLRSREILEAEGINPTLRYQVFSRNDIESLTGVREAAEFIKSMAGDRVTVYALEDGQSYEANDALMKIEGRAQDLIDLETGYLSILSGSLTGPLDMEKMREKARAIIQNSGGKPVYYFGARHFAPELDEGIARICQEEGFVGTSTDIGAKAWNSQGVGTIPHALILSYQAHMEKERIQGNPTVEAAKAFNKLPVPIESNNGFPVLS